MFRTRRGTVLMKQKKSRTPKRKPTQSKKVVAPLIYGGESRPRSQGYDLTHPLVLSQEVPERAPFALADAPGLQLP